MVEASTEWHNWKKALHSLVDAGEFVGLSQDSMDKIAYKIGEFLANHIDPGNREQRLLKELWEVANDHEQLVLATLILRLVEPGRVAL